MAISAALVKELRERTGSGMMECKKALVEANGDIEAAIEAMRKSGLAKADKKADRVAAEGIIAMNIAAGASRGVMIEINSETDFVAKADDFLGFANKVAQCTVDAKPADLEALLSLNYAEGETINEARQRLIAKIGENISIRRFADLTASNGVVGGYSHGVRIGVLVELTGGDEALAKDIAMHIAASKPVCVSADQVSPEVIASEKDIYTAQAADSGKPAEIVEKMVQGRINKFLKEVTLLGQPFVKDPDMTVEALLKKSGATVVRFARFEVGEGIEKKQDNFAEEVMSQVRGG
jgi:elongation factor Ts